MLCAVINSLVHTVSLQAPKPPCLLPTTTHLSPLLLPCLWPRVDVCKCASAQVSETGWSWQGVEPSLVITICSAPLYSNHSVRHHPNKIVDLPCSPQFHHVPTKEQETDTKHLVTPALLFHMKAQRPISSVKMKGQMMRWEQTPPKSRMTSKEAGRKLNL